MHVAAANDDIILLIQEDEDMQFMDSVGATNGVGPNQVVGAYDDHQSQMVHPKTFGQILLNRNAVQ